MISQWAEKGCTGNKWVSSTASFIFNDNLAKTELFQKRFPVKISERQTCKTTMKKLGQ